MLIQGFFARVDAGWRLGPRALGHRLAHAARRGAAIRALADAPPPAGPFWPATPGPPLPADAGPWLAAAAALDPAPDWHGGHDARAHGAALDPYAAGDIRPLWERHRLGALPLLALAHRAAPEAGHLARAEALLADWCAKNPPFRGPGWACAQEAAFRALHLLLAAALLGAPPPRALLALHARRIAATPHYALAQDNNHPISEAAGLFACALALGEDPGPHAAALAARVARLVAPDGGFANLSPGYHRLLLDTLSLAEWFRRRAGAPAFPPPFCARAAAATAWLDAITDRRSGAAPRLGLEDDSALADLGGQGPRDARGSLWRAHALFGPASAAAPGEAAPRAPAAAPALAALGLAAPALPPQPARLAAGGVRLWRQGRWMLLLRTGPLRFRPFQCDLLHLDVWLDGAPFCADAGTGAYNPPSLPLWGTAAHNTVQFDGAEQMPRAGRFLLARWPRIEALADGAAVTDARGRRHERRVAREGAGWRIEDRLFGPFRRATLRWRVADSRAALTVEADAPLAIRGEAMPDSPRYGQTREAAGIACELAAPGTRFVTRITAQH